jgi:hypothetical protein
VTADEYCRGLEAHLTRRNDGHLIRIVGPAFDMVRGWFERGVPFKIATHGIDRTLDRYYAKGPRRRPVRIDYCEADVLDAFDEWRRAVGLRAAGEAVPAGPKRAGLATGIRRAVAKLTASRGGDGVWIGEAGAEIDRIVQALDALASRAERARGSMRAAVVDELATLDGRLLAAARRAVAPEVIRELEAQAETDLAPFRDRMPDDAWHEARQAAVTVLLRAHAQLPSLAGLGATHEPPEGEPADPPVTR